MVLEKVIIEAKEGDHDAFKKIFDHMSDRLFVYTNMRASSRDDALDIVQDTFVDLWKGLVTFTYESDEAFYGFVFIILKRKLYHYRCRTQNTVSFEDIDIAEDNSVYENLHDVRTQIEALRPQHRELIKLRYWSGLPFKEIALTLNIKETTAKVWHHRALKKLKSNTTHYDNT